MNFKVFWIIVLIFIVFEVSGEHSHNDHSEDKPITGDHTKHISKLKKYIPHPRCWHRRTTTARPATSTAPA